MVRIKHRYLLFNILYPSTSPPPSNPSSTTSASTTPSCTLFASPSPAHLSPAYLFSLIRDELHTLFGDHGLSVTQNGMRIVYFSQNTSTGILRVPRSHFRIVWAALAFLERIPAPSARTGRSGGGGGGGGSQATSSKDVPCVVRVVRVSGTIRKSEEELLRRARRELVRAKLEGRGAEPGQRDGLSMFTGAAPNSEQNAAATAGPLAADKDIFDDDDEEEDEAETPNGD